jgi:hypothetical protein
MYWIRDTQWKFWFYTNMLLLIGLLITPVALQWAALLTLFQLAFYLTEGSSRQSTAIRLGYLTVMVIGCVPGFSVIPWILLLTTSCYLLITAAPHRNLALDTETAQ